MDAQAIRKCADPECGRQFEPKSMDQTFCHECLEAVASGTADGDDVIGMTDADIEAPTADDQADAALSDSNVDATEGQLFATALIVPPNCLAIVVGRKDGGRFAEDHDRDQSQPLAVDVEGWMVLDGVLSRLPIDRTTDVICQIGPALRSASVSKVKGVKPS